MERGRLGRGARMPAGRGLEIRTEREGLFEGFVTGQEVLPTAWQWTGRKRRAALFVFCVSPPRVAEGHPPARGSCRAFVVGAVLAGGCDARRWRAVASPDVDGPRCDFVIGLLHWVVQLLPRATRLRRLTPCSITKYCLLATEEMRRRELRVHLFQLRHGADSAGLQRLHLFLARTISHDVSRAASPIADRDPRRS